MCQTLETLHCPWQRLRCQLRWIEKEELELQALCRVLGSLGFNSGRAGLMALMANFWHNIQTQSERLPEHAGHLVREVDLWLRFGCAAASKNQPSHSLPSHRGSTSRIFA